MLFNSVYLFKEESRKHGSLQIMLISKSNSWNLLCDKCKITKYASTNPLLPPFLSSSSLHVLYSSCIILLLVAHKQVSNLSTSIVELQAGAIMKYLTTWVPISQNSCLISQKRGQTWARHGCSWQSSPTPTLVMATMFFWQRKSKKVRS